MPHWADYYRVLQVHQHAEPEIIESAFKRLAKKYHPDLNSHPQSEQMMKQINEAYEILKNPSKRRLYDQEWLRNNMHQQAEKRAPRQEFHEIQALAAKNALTEYFHLIQSQQFEKAYGLVTIVDQKRIAKKEFIQWQKAVSRIFQLQSFDLKATKREKEVLVNGVCFKEAVDFAITTVETNIVMNRLEKDLVTKRMVLEKGEWRIYTGYKDVKELIVKFEDLAKLLDAKSVIGEMIELYSLRDELTGLYNKKGFIEIVEKEIWRYNRYHAGFSIMKLMLKQGDDKDGKESSLVTWFSKLLTESFRKLDSICRWEEASWLVLMPETRLPEAIRAAMKIKRIIENKKKLFYQENFKFLIGIEEYKGSLESTIEQLNNYMQGSHHFSHNPILYKEGVWVTKP